MKTIRYENSPPPIEIGKLGDAPEIVYTPTPIDGNPQTEVGDDPNA